MKFLQHKYFPTEMILQIYNITVLSFILIFNGNIEQSTTYLLIHIFLAIAIHTVNYLKSNYDNILLNFFIVIAPILTFFFYHYESGVINLCFFSSHLDPLIQRWDLLVFGKHFHEIWANVVNCNIIDQVIHFSYFSYYGILILPAFFLMLKERKNRHHWQDYRFTRKLIFALTFTMLLSYVIFIIFPVKGPVEYHSTLFPGPKGMVAVMDFLYANGDSDGGAFPSSHVAVSFVILIFVFRHFKEIRWYLLPFFLGLVIGTVYCSYHYMIDSVAGLIMGGICYYCAEKVFNWMDSKQ
ncbi:phosphatase PAP2 family protein [Methanococcoides sp. SA1]|nr:phosphatase PAP2 family protein [Methanococcoides sp. SA1]